MVGILREDQPENELNSNPVLSYGVLKIKAIRRFFSGVVHTAVDYRVYLHDRFIVRPGLPLL